MFRDAGCAELADDIGETLVGRDIANDQWSFYLVKAYDSSY